MNVAVRLGSAAMRELRGKACLITGAGSGIGKATAQAAAAKGARLVLTDVDAAALDEAAAALGPAVLAHRAFDIADREAVQAFATDVHGAHGSMDVVMNVAGISTWGRVDRLEARHWRDCVE